MPPLDAETLALLQYIMSQGGGDPSSMASLFGGMIQPNVNKYGELDQFGVDLQKTNLNQYQDIYGSLDDPMNALLSGVGAFGGTPTGGGFVGGGGLNPITTETIMETPALQQMGLLASLAGQGQVTPETYIASMLSQNVLPSVITADLMAKMQDPSLDATTKNLFNSWLPQTELKDMQGNPTGERTIDWNAAAKKVEDFSTPYLQETAKIGGPNIGQNAFGQYVQYSEQPSEMMQYLQKLGLPDPRAQYGIDFSIQNDPELYDLYQSIGEKGMAFDEAKKSYEGYLKRQPQARELIRWRDTAERRSGERADERYRSDMQQYMRDVADWATGGITTEQEAYNKRNREGAPGTPGWLKSVGGAISGLPGEVNDAIARVAGKPIAPRGAPRLPSNVDLVPEFNRAAPPTLPERAQNRSVMEQMLSGVKPVGRRGEYALAGAMNAAGRTQGEDMLAMVRAIAPGYGAMRAGRSPFKDAVMQRLQPLFAVGAAG